MKIKQTYLLRASFAFLLLMFLGYLVKFYPDNLTGIDTNIQSAMR
ncbi:phosphatase PAP2 family protein, partial [Streptococcus mutans]|nr:phosphatase PAP2 family protein [Streptococcus mutans]